MALKVKDEVKKLEEAIKKNKKAHKWHYSNEKRKSREICSEMLSGRRRGKGSDKGNSKGEIVKTDKDILVGKKEVANDMMDSRTLSGYEEPEDGKRKNGRLYLSLGTKQNLEVLS